MHLLDLWKEHESAKRIELQLVEILLVELWPELPGLPVTNKQHPILQELGEVHLDSYPGIDPVIPGHGLPVLVEGPGFLLQDAPALEGLAVGLEVLLEQLQLCWQSRR